MDKLPFKSYLFIQNLTWSMIYVFKFCIYFTKIKNVKDVYLCVCASISIKLSYLSHIPNVGYKQLLFNKLYLNNFSYICDLAMLSEFGGLTKVTIYPSCTLCSKGLYSMPL